MRNIYFLLAMLFIAGKTWGQVVAWQFDGAAGNEATSNATTNHPDLNQSILSRGSGVAASSLVRTFSSDNFTLNGTKPNAVTTSDFMSFTINAKPGFSVSLSTLDAKLRRAATGPNTYIWKYSTDGTNFSEIGSDISFTSTAADGVIQSQINLSGIGALQNVQNTTSITFRLYAWGATGSSGSFAFGRFAMGNTTNSLAIGGTTAALSPTPVELLSFAGQKEGTKNLLRWTTATEINNRGFEVQYSKDGLNYSVLAFVPSLGQGGFSNGQLHYSFADINPAGSKHYYRLRQMDYDGHNKFSSVILIRGNKPVNPAIGGIFPNPVKSGVMNVIIDVPKDNRVTLVVTDLSGRIFKQQMANVQSGTNTISVEIGNFGKGIYFVRLSGNENGEAAVSKFIKE